MKFLIIDQYCTIECDFLFPINIPLFRAPKLEHGLSVDLQFSSLDEALRTGVVVFLNFVVFRQDNILFLASSLDNDS